MKVERPRMQILVDFSVPPPLFNGQNPLSWPKTFSWRHLNMSKYITIRIDSIWFGETENWNRQRASNWGNEARKKLHWIVCNARKKRIWCNKWFSSKLFLLSPGGQMATFVTINKACVKGIGLYFKHLTMRYLISCWY